MRTQKRSLTLGLLLFLLLPGVLCSQATTAYTYRKIALDGVPLSIPYLSDRGEGCVITDGNSLVWVRWPAGIEKILPLRRGVKGAFPGRNGRVLVWFEDGGIQVFSEKGVFLREIRARPRGVRSILESEGGYLLVQYQDGVVELYGLGGAKLLDWGPPDRDSFPLRLIGDSLALVARGEGDCALRRFDGKKTHEFRLPQDIKAIESFGKDKVAVISGGGTFFISDLRGNIVEKPTLVSFPKEAARIFLDPEGNSAYLDQKGDVTIVPRSSFMPLTFTLNWGGSKVSSLALSPSANSILVGDTQWVAHWIYSPPEEGVGSLKDEDERLRLPESIDLAEQYYKDLASGSYGEKMDLLLEEGKAKARSGSLRMVLQGLKEGLKVLISRNELGATLRAEGVRLLAAVGDGTDGNWLAQRLLKEPEPRVRTAFLEALRDLAFAPNLRVRKGLFEYLFHNQKQVTLTELGLSLDFLERVTRSTGVGLQPEEGMVLSLLASRSPSFQRMVLSYLRK